MDEVRIGFIGCGGNARGHMRRLVELDNATIVGVCDLDEERAKEASSLTGGEAYTDFRRMLERDDLDAAYLSLPVFAHGEPERAVIDRGLPFLVEKPVALNRQDAEAVLRAHQDSGRFITSNLILRQSPRFKDVRQRIAAGEFGEVFCIEGDYIHDILWKIMDGWRGRMATYCTIFGGGNPQRGPVEEVLAANQ